MIQRSRRAARMVYADYQTTSSVSTMLNQLQWTTLQERRAQAKACMMYPVVNQLIDIPSQILVPTRYDNVILSPLLLPARVTNRSHSTYGSSARSDSHRVVFCPNSVVTCKWLEKLTGVKDKYI